MESAKPADLSLSSMMDTRGYLQRINYDGPLDRSAETLRRLQHCHLLSVPFENLSIHSHQQIVLTDEALFEKIVTRKRGGFCYELNGLFSALLRELGFGVTMLSAQVANAEGVFGPDFDHMTLLVTEEQRWLVDVGFGDSFLEPLLLDVTSEQVQDERAYRLSSEGETLVLYQKLPEEQWKAQYRFTLAPYQYADYAAMCEYHQTSPNSHFTKARICSRATRNGRMTLSGMRLIVTANGKREERLLSSEAEYAAILAEHFGIKQPSPNL